MDYEKEYYNKLEVLDKALENYVKTQTPLTKKEYKEAEKDFGFYCMDILNLLIEENSDVLKRLKNT